MKNNILDVTFTIPIRIDNNDRLRNFKLIKAYLQKYFYTNIIVGESSPEPRLKNICKDCGYIYYKNNSDIFHRTKILNDLARIASTVFIVNYDGDVLIPPEQISKSVNLLRSNKFDMVLPYKGMAKNIIEEKINKFERTLSLYAINEIKDTYEMNANAVGGAVFWSKHAFFYAGMENENFINWGCEDNERLTRAMKLKLAIGRVNGRLYHLNHSRNIKENEEQKFYKDNIKELRKIMDMNEHELRNYIKTWEWLK